MTTRTLTLMIAAAGLAACGIEPDVGRPLAGVCSNADTNPDVAISFREQIRPLLARGMSGCGCHQPGGPGLQLAGFDVSSLSSLRAGGFNSGARIVVDGDPCGSVMFQKVYEAPPFGSRMPLGGPYWSEEELDLLHDWIAEGASDN